MFQFLLSLMDFIWRSPRFKVTSPLYIKAKIGMSGSSGSCRQKNLVIVESFRQHTCESWEVNVVVNKTSTPTTPFSSRDAAVTRGQMWVRRTGGHNRVQVISASWVVVSKRRHADFGNCWHPSPFHLVPTPITWAVTKSYTVKPGNNQHWTWRATLNQMTR